MAATLKAIAKKIQREERLSKADGITLFESDDIFTVGEWASIVARKINGDKVYYVRNHHINPTNICVNRCKFCAFSRSKGDQGAYELTIDEIIDKLKMHSSKPTQEPLTPFTEVHIVGGLHPDWPFEHYLALISAIKKNFPAIYIKAFTAVEIDYLSRVSQLGLEETLKKLKKYGLDTMPGGGAEIFASHVRDHLCPEKISGQRWLDIHEKAHKAGIKTNATMLYGHIESYQDRVDHLFSLRELQDRTHGFQAFIPLSYHPMNTEIGGSYSSGVDDLKTIAISRLILDNFPHIKAYWIMLGEKISQTALLFGADDLDGTVIEERITHAAGATTRENLTEPYLRHLIQKAGKEPVERDSFYREKPYQH